MFLDDELLEMCRTSDVTDINKLYIAVCDKCQEYYKQRVEIGMPRKEVKIILDRSFKLFDSFVRQAKNSKERKLQLLGELFEKLSFKRQFMDNEKLKSFYESL